MQSLIAFIVAHLTLPFNHLDQLHQLVLFVTQNIQALMLVENEVNLLPMGLFFLPCWPTDIAVWIFMTNNGHARTPLQLVWVYWSFSSSHTWELREKNHLDLAGLASKPAICPFHHCLSNNNSIILGSSCSTVVERMPHDWEVVGSNSTGCLALFLFSIPPVVCP